MRIATSCQIQRLDKIAIQKFKIPSTYLMENAGRKSAQIILKNASPKDKVAIFCGCGNNGGDGFVIARHLFNKKIGVVVFLIGKKENLKPDADINYHRFIKLGGKVKGIPDLNSFTETKQRIETFDLIVDAIFGIGLKGALKEPYLSIIDFLNKSAKPIIAIDVPSGLDATSGKVLGNCIRATTTITLSLAKKGFYKNQGPKSTGKIVVVDIGIPQVLIKRLIK